MVMDQPLRRLYQSMNGIKLDKASSTILLGQNFTDGFKLQGPYLDKNDVDVPPWLPDTSSGNLPSWSSAGVEENLHEDCDFNDVALKYISQILMEEDMEEKTCMLQESLALEATEKSFYNVIGENYPPSIDHHRASSIDEIHEDQYENNCSSFGGDNLVEPGWNWDVGEYRYPHMASQSTSSSFRSSNSADSKVDGFVDEPKSILEIPNIFSGSESSSQFRRGAEEARKFLPNGNGLFVGVVNNLSGLLVGEVKQGHEDMGFKVEKKHPNEHFAEGSRGKRNSHPEDLDAEEDRNTKLSAIFDELTVRSEMLDQVLLCDAVKSEAALRESLKNEASKTLQQQECQSKRSNLGKSRAVVAGNQRSANDQLKLIRQHASPMGDGMQRMAYYFVNGLEARLRGSGTEIYKGVLTRGTSAANILKAYHLFLAICPFKKLLNFFSNTTIRKLAEKAESLHIIDFGILYGFQWPSLIQCLSSRPGGPPKLRITGIDLPKPGFRPAERVQETGRRLANYAKSFNVPFEFNAIAQKWETIQVEDLKIDTEDVLVVNCHCRFRNLLDETVTVESPRDTVLNLIRKLNPVVFIQGIVNGGYGAPFFRTRFREALFHYSALFDMLEHIVPRERLERTVIEREFFGWEAMNVIACEGSERIERPESYRQCQFRNMRAGFMQLPLDEEIVNKAKEKLKLCYHKDFILYEDGPWLLQGWKGRMLFAISSWKPA
ncbi:Scarecrow-like protein 14 [Vitis vinifera]|uniref:Scarecrow-like protein 14 n=1 Tax=Vitis vinifera TaxID=29760 RepID=A0A438ENV2_VITVI|nr:Scarecrow-like protein 14 [Vitis vinifera]